MKNIKRVLLVLILITTQIFAESIAPREEFRGVWLSTVTNIDWPKSKYDTDIKKQADLKDYIEKMKDTGLNAVLFQVRCACDAMYESPYEPWSYWFSGTQGQGPSMDWDPLEFAVEEAHKLGMEMHAWVNPYRAVKTPSMINDPDYLNNEHISKTHPEWILKFSDIHILDPGLPEVRDYITMILMDIVNRYDIDGLHMDDYFYPYSIIENEDAQTFALHSRGFTNVHDWRRDNINLLVEMVNDSINIVKPWVKWGISPFGVWKPNVPAGISSMDAFNILYCDPIAWLEAKTVDYITPQCYWPFGGGQDYGLLIPWWASQAKTYGRHFYPGQGLFHVYDADWDVDEIPNQIELNRNTEYCDGSVYFTAHSFNRNAKGVIDTMRTNYYNVPAMWPLMEWKDSLPPSPPLNAMLMVNDDGSKSLSWSSPAYTNPADSGYAYAIYRAPHPIDDLDMTNLKDLRIDQSRLYNDNEEGMFYYGITALNRYKLESPIAQIDYPFVHPLFPEYADDWTTKDPVLIWAEKEGANQYTLEFSDSESFMGATQYIVNDTTKDFALEYETNYWWRVKADNTTEWSPIWTFTTELPPQVDIVSPLAFYEGTDLDPLLSWNHFEDADSYELQVSLNETMDTPFINQSNVSDTSWQLNSLDFGTFYYWRIRSNKYDRWTDINAFKTREEYITTLWDKTRLSKTYPAYFSIEMEAAALAQGTYFGNEILLVLQSSEDSVSIDALDALSGVDVSFSLNLEGVSGGKYALRDIEISEDGVIYATNCARVGESFKIYQWIDPLQAPEVVYQADNIAYRLGDHFTVSGRNDNGTIKLYIPAAKSDKLVKLDWNVVSSSFEASQITLGRGNNTNPTVALVPGKDELYMTSNEYYLRHFNADGTNIDWMRDNLSLPVNANSIVAFSYNNKSYVAGYVQDSESAHIIDVSSGVKTALFAGSTYRMGVNENPELLGDIEVLDNQDGTFTLFVLGNQNGLAAYTYDAASAMLDIAEIANPQSFNLGQNYPNPFNPITIIPYELKESAETQISLYDLNGRFVKNLYKGIQTSGYHQFELNASDLSSGIYFVKMNVGNESMSRKITLLK